MVIERTKDEVIIRLPGALDTTELQQFVDYLTYAEATAGSNADQAKVDQLAKEIKKGWWAKNRSRLVK